MTGRFYLSGDQMLKYGSEAIPYSVRGVHPGHKILENSEMIDGRYLNDIDLKESRKVIVIGKVIKEELFGDVSPVGKEITSGDITYKVIGVFYDSGGENEMSKAYIPMSTAQKIYSDGKTMHQIMVDGGDLSIKEMGQLEEKIFASFAQRKGFDPTDRRAIRINNRAEDYQQFASLFTAFNVLTWIIGFFSIMAGVIGVSNIMLIIVKDRTKEIGIRKALGATPWSIISMILQESILITSVAGYIGMILGISIIYAASGAESEYFRHPTVNLSVVILATLTLVIAGALAGLLPALKAANINPVNAIKSE
jgi:putative ABC transport system permease protein